MFSGKEKTETAPDGSSTREREGQGKVKGIDTEFEVVEAWLTSLRRRGRGHFERCWSCKRRGERSTDAGSYQAGRVLVLRRTTAKHALNSIQFIEDNFFIRQVREQSVLIR